MNKILKRGVFVEDGRDRTSENLSYMLFSNINYQDDDLRVTSFQRSDFTRSRIKDMKFYGNNFDRADLIDVFASDSVFENVNFGICLIDNVVFERVTFSGNSYTGVDMKNSSFSHCLFTAESLTANMTGCVFVNCSFENFKTPQSTLSRNRFVNCSFKCADMAECIAENSVFDSCVMSDVALCATHWATYIFRDTNLNEISFKYRGECIDVWNSDGEFGFQRFWEKDLYFEYVNSLVFVGAFKGNSRFPAVFSMALSKALELSPQLRTYTVSNLLDMMKQYCGSPLIGYDAFAETLEILRQLTFEDVPFEEELEYQCAIFAIEKTFDRDKNDLLYALEIPKTRRCEVVLRLNSSSENEAVDYARRLFLACSRYLGYQKSDESVFVCTNISRGSYLLTIVTYLLIASLLAETIKKCSQCFNEARVEWHVANAKIRMIDAVRNPNQLEKTFSLLHIEEQKTTPSNENLKELSEMITEGEIVSMIIDPLET